MRLAKMAHGVLQSDLMTTTESFQATSRYQTEAFDAGRLDASSTERSHAVLRTILASHFHVNRKSWNIVTLCRQSIAVSPAEFRVTDICILEAGAPIEQIVRVPPIICIDIIGDEPLAVVQNRVDVYDRLGVKQIWLIDPRFRSAWKGSSSGMFQIKNDEMGIPGTAVGFRLSSIFAEMDELLRPSRRTHSPSSTERGSSSDRSRNHASAPINVTER